MVIPYLVNQQFFWIFLFIVFPLQFCCRRSIPGPPRLPEMLNPLAEGLGNEGEGMGWSIQAPGSPVRISPFMPWTVSPVHWYL